jgi:hypothetical protein
MGNVFDVNIEGIKDNKYSIEVDLLSNDISVEVIKEERSYDISIETANFSSLVSPNDGNRLSRTVEGGLFVPEIDFDLTSIYEEAKV